MPLRLIDLSVMVENSPSEPMRMRVRRLDPRRGAWRLCLESMWNTRLPLARRLRQAWSFLIGRTRILPSAFPDRAFLTLDHATLPTHMGTHVDAPIHYGPPAGGGQAMSVEQLPIDWFYRPGVRLDLRHKAPGSAIEQADIAAALAKTNHSLAPLDIVLIWTGTADRWGTREYFSHAPGMSREATAWLVERGVKVIGIDSYGLDRPFQAMLADYYRSRDPSHLWPSHFYGREQPYIHIERLTNLDKLPPTGFHVACFPLRLRGLDASWVRAVGIVEDPTLPVN